jgi:peroxisomal enoyl-CoA hydratase 2
MDTSLIGTKTAVTRIAVERGPVANFARAVLADDPIFFDARAAEAAGLGGIPAPLTFGFAMANWGAYPEIQPDPGPDVDPSAMRKAMAELTAEGGLMLHGEQSFRYHRPLLVGDVLVGESTIVDMYEKESKGRKMKFLVSETVYRDDRTGEPVLTTRMNLICRS